MHELSISRAILDTAIGHADGRRVVLVSVTIGALRQVVPESLEFYFQLVSRDTVCDGAPLDWRLEAARLHCACGAEWELDAPAFRCPHCSRGQVTVLTGDQLSVDSIEVEEEDPCTAPR